MLQMAEQFHGMEAGHPEGIRDVESDEDGAVTTFLYPFRRARLPQPIFYV